MEQPPKLIVPKKTTRRELAPRIRRHLEERFRESERIEELVLVNGSCYVKVRKPIPEYSSMNRLQFHDEEFHLRYEIVRGSGGIVMEG